MEKKTILITGHKGFIGGHLWRAFEQLGGVDLKGIDLKDGVDLLDCDLPDCDLCFHLAANSDAHSEDDSGTAEINIGGTLKVLEAYGNNVVFASSSAVNYPFTGYAISKMAAEAYCRIYSAWVVRLCNIHGEGGHGVFEKFARDDFLKIARDGNQLRTYAPIKKAIEALIAAPTQRPGALIVLPGEDLSVNQIALKYFGNKPIEFVERHPCDIEDGVQICP